MRVLVVRAGELEDLYLAQRLQSLDVNSDELVESEAVSARLADVAYDCLVLPASVNGDARELVGEIRRERPDLAVIVIADGGPSVRAEFLRTGADECLAHPSDVREILEHVQRLVMLERKPSQQETVRVGDVELNLAVREVRVRGKPVHFPPQQFSLFTYMMSNRHRVVPTHELVEHCWGPAAADRGKPVYHHISRLRAILGDAVRIDAVQGFGYRLVDTS